MLFRSLFTALQHVKKSHLIKKAFTRNSDNSVSNLFIWFYPTPPPYI